MELIEALAVLTGIAGVWLTVRQRVWCWPVGLVSVTLFAVVFFDARLYGSAALQSVYAALSLYGWYTWRHPADGSGELRVTRTPARWWPVLALAGVAGAVAFGVVLRDRTDAALPLVDGATTAFSLVAQWMTTRKWIETWILWIGVDVVYVGMYASQGLYATTGLYVVFLVLALVGYRAWRRSMRPSAGDATS
jgi:nicotinamide mononucleotide transporter